MFPALIFFAIKSGCNEPRFASELIDVRSQNAFDLHFPSQRHFSMRLAYHLFYVGISGKLAVA